MANKEKINLNEMELDLETLDKISGGWTELGPNSRSGRKVPVTNVQVCPFCGCTEVLFIAPMGVEGRGLARCKDCKEGYIIETK